MSAAEAVIEVSGIVKKFGDKTVVDHFDIRVPKGAIYGFLGPNGSGKTTTIRMLCGLLTPDAGDGKCLGFDILRQSDSIKEHVGYMTQKFSLYEDLTIRENLDFMARMYQVPNRKRNGFRKRFGRSGSGGALPPVCRQPFRRLETAPGAGGLSPAQPRTAAAGRADRGCRSQGPA